MAAPDINGLFESLSASMEAQDALAERADAEDLATALEQDADIAEAVSRWSGARVHAAELPGFPVTEIGKDHVSAGTGPLAIIALSRVILLPDPGSCRPLSTDRTMAMALRDWARGHRKVIVSTEGRAYRGLLKRAGRDHLVVVTGATEVLIAYGAIDWVRLDPGD